MTFAVDYAGLAQDELPVLLADAWPPVRSDHISQHQVDFRGRGAEAKWEDILIA